MSITFYIGGLHFNFEANLSSVCIAVWRWNWTYSTKKIILNSE